MTNKTTWRTDSKHSTFESADAKRSLLLESDSNLSVKVRRRSDNTYVLKVRSEAVDETPSKSLKNKKTKNRAARRNEKNKRNKN